MTAAAQCPDCGATFRPGEAACPGCGVELTEDTRPDLSGEELRARYGKPEQIDAAWVLAGPLADQAGAVSRGLGGRNPVVAFRYESAEAAEAFAAANLRHHGHTSLGPVDAGVGGIVGVVVLNLAEFGHG